MSRVRAALRDPHAVLALACCVVLGGASAGVDRSLAWPCGEGAVAGLALVHAWRRRAELRLAPLLVLGAAFQFALVAIHLGLDVRGDLDARVVYTETGRALLDGRYPVSAYPAGAVGLFAFETWAGGGAARAANAFAMIPFQLACVGGVWALRGRWSPWLAACVAVWPLNAFFWEYRFDLAPAAAIAVGAALATRGRWHAAGWALGLGFALKWTPGLTALGLVLWLASSGQLRAARRHVAGLALPLLLVHLPLLAVAPGAVAAPYRNQGVRTITAESLPYLPLRLLGLATPARHYYGAASVPWWANGAAAALQLAAVAAILVVAARAAHRRTAVGAAALAPAAFLLANRIFSPQFLVVVLVSCAVAVALLARSPGAVGAVALAIAAATIANATLFPALAGPLATEPGWLVASATALLASGAAVAGLGLIAAGVRVPRVRLSGVAPVGRA